jgi:hypothetical protein
MLEGWFLKVGARMVRKGERGSAEVREVLEQYVEEDGMRDDEVGFHQLGNATVIRSHRLRNQCSIGRCEPPPWPLLKLQIPMQTSLPKLYNIPISQDSVAGRYTPHNHHRHGKLQRHV